MNLVEKGLRIEFSPDVMETRIELLDLVRGEPLRHDDIEEALAEAGVVFGIDTAAFEAVLRGESSVVVACGLKPINGIDGSVEYFFDVDAKPTVTGGPLVIRNVRKGDLLAVIHPPQDGTQGMTVLGNAVQPRPGRRASVSTGSNATRDPSDSARIVATVDGNAVLGIGNSISVIPQILIRGDLDLSVGNVDFVGSLVVEGDIKSDVVVKVEKDLQVRGGIEDAIVDVGGNAVIHKGFTGHGNGRLTAKGDVRLHHLRNQTVVAGRDIVVELEAIGGKLSAGHDLMARTAVLVGGCYEADHDIVVKQLGNEEGTQVKVRAGKRGRLVARIGETDRERIHAEKQLAEVKEAVFKLTLARMNGSLPEEKAGVLQKLQEALALLPDRIAALTEEKRSLMCELEKAHNSSIEVMGQVFDNVMIDINGSKRMIEQPLRRITFVESNRAVEVQ